MAFVDTIRDASEHAGELAQRGVERVVHAIDDLEQRLRHRMRIYPSQRKKRYLSRMETDFSLLGGEATSVNSSGDLLGMMVRSSSAGDFGFPTSHEPAPEVQEEKEETRRKPIISINGKDVREPGLDRDAA